MTTEAKEWFSRWKTQWEQSYKDDGPITAEEQVLATKLAGFCMWEKILDNEAIALFCWAIWILGDKEKFISAVNEIIQIVLQKGHGDDNH